VILLEINLGLSPFKIQSKRFITEFFDFLGDIGGFYGSLDLLAFKFGEYFSGKFFLIAIVNSLFRTQLSLLPNKKNQSNKKYKS
jgi:hypothetical protein